MKTRVAIMIILMCLSTLLAPAPASARFGDSAQGHGEDVFADRFKFTTEGFGPAIDVTATGTWEHKSTNASPFNQSVKGRVHCLRVVGNTATFAGVIEAPAVFAGWGFRVQVVDIAKPGAGADRYGWDLLSAFSFPTDCFAPVFTSPIVKGDIKVVASTFPN